MPCGFCYAFTNFSPISSFPLIFETYLETGTEAGSSQNAQDRKTLLSTGLANSSTAFLVAV